MDTALPQKFPFILDRNLAKANCSGNRVCTSCDTVVLGCEKNVFFCSNASIFADFAYDWYFMISLFKFLRAKYNIRTW